MLFFVVSKIAGFFLIPINVVFLLLLVGVILIWSPWRRLGRWLLSIAAVISVFLALVPLGTGFNIWIENRFPANPALPDNVTGIVVLGGALDPRISAKREVTALNGSVERITEFARLAKRFPDARLIYTGGSGSLLHQGDKEADYAAPFLQQLGLDPQLVIFENQSRNTFENAVFSYDLASPKPGENWILVTSAAHMPRAVGCFRKAGWPGLIPYPVDYQYAGDENIMPPLSLSSGSGKLSSALHEILGLATYYLSGKTDALLPAP